MTCPSSLFWQLLVFLTTLIASIVIFARSMRWRRFQLEFRSPVVVNPTDSTKPEAGAAPDSVAGRHGAGTNAKRRCSERSGTTGDRPIAPRRSWVVEARALAWQTMKEGRKTWCLLAAIGLVCPVLLIYLELRRHLEATCGSWWTEHRHQPGGRGQRIRAREPSDGPSGFSLTMGHEPGLVWLVKLAVWGMGMAVIWGPLAVDGWDQLVALSDLALSVDSVLLIRLRSFLLLLRRIALVCGMAIRRGITAVVIALVIGLALTIPLVAIMVAQHAAGARACWPFRRDFWRFRGHGAATGCWSGRPLGDGCAWGCSSRACSVCLVSWYAGYRAWSIRDVGPIAPPAAWIEAASSPLPADQNAAEPLPRSGTPVRWPFQGFTGVPRPKPGNTRPAPSRGGAASTAGFCNLRKLTVLDRPDLPPGGTSSPHLLALDASERQNHGDLAGAWDDIVALFRMAHQSSERGGAFNPLSRGTDRTGPGPGVGRCSGPDARAPSRGAGGLPRPTESTPAAEIVRAEANLVENALDLPTSRFRDWVFESTSQGNRPLRHELSRLPLFDLATMPWERVRARRVNRLICQCGDSRRHARTMAAVPRRAVQRSSMPRRPRGTR